jgi:ankyrin repeat protein
LLVLKHFTYFNKFLGYGIVTDLGLLDLYKHIIQRMSYDAVNDGVTALEVAVKDENVLLCEIIIRIIKEVNLEEYDRLTMFKNVSNTILGLDDLHESFFKIAATKGYLQVFELLIKNLPANKNPMFNSGGSPLHLAAKNGHLEACQLILSNLEEKNPYINLEWITPYHLAAQNGQLEVCKLFIELLMDKNPRHGGPPVLDIVYGPVFGNVFYFN